MLEALQEFNPRFRLLRNSFVELPRKTAFEAAILRATSATWDSWLHARRHWILKKQAVPTKFQCRTRRGSWRVRKLGFHKAMASQASVSVGDSDHPVQAPLDRRYTVSPGIDPLSNHGESIQRSGNDHTLLRSGHGSPWADRSSPFDGPTIVSEVTAFGSQRLGYAPADAHAQPPAMLVLRVEDLERLSMRRWRQGNSRKLDAAFRLRV